MKYFKSLLLFSLFFIIVGCSGGSYKISIGDIEYTSSTDTIQGSYKSFDGYYFKNVKLSEGEIITFNLSTITDEGTIRYEFFDSDGNLISVIEDSKEITIDKNDTYKVKITANNHKGSFMLSWDIQ